MITILGILCFVVVALDLLSFILNVLSVGNIVGGVAYAICRPLWMPMGMLSGLVIHLAIWIGLSILGGVLL